MTTFDPHEATMWLSTRKRLRKGNSEWNSFTEFVELSHLSEVRSIDSFCNPCREGNFAIASLADLWDKLESLQAAEKESEYHLLFVDSDHHNIFTHQRLTFLGCDLSDETWTSTLLNCGPWKGPLAALAAGSRPNGLLELSAAKTAQSVLPEEWDDDPHSHVTIWALYEVARETTNG